jgi:hypothetical protein
LICAVTNGWTSSRLPVSGFLRNLKLRGFLRDVDPSCAADTCDLDADEWTETALFDAVVAVADNGAVDLLGDDQDPAGRPWPGAFS